MSRIRKREPISNENVCVVRYLSTAIRNSDRYSYKHAEIKGQHGKQEPSSHRTVYKAVEDVPHLQASRVFNNKHCFNTIKALNAPLHRPGVATRIHKMRNEAVPCSCNTV